jgi:hypothetical protein
MQVHVHVSQSELDKMVATDVELERGIYVVLTSGIDTEEGTIYPGLDSIEVHVVVTN